MFSRDKFDIEKLKNEFIQGEPFNYIVIDNFLDTLFIKDVEKELRDLPEENWYDKTTNFSMINNQPDCATQSKKLALNIRSQIPDNANKIIDLFAYPEIIQFIEDITGITSLQSDDSLLGGGIHKTTKGGHLSIHADFNIHPNTKKHRRVNALLYLNTEWKQEYNGELEMWSKDMNNCVHKISPICNRLVIFRITDDAFHGHPEIWNAPLDYPRLSFAFYYYTDNRPENEKNAFHWAAWQKRYNVIY
jgi:Rps23 Pro-64 3,4-dihydroxylase Tpa1-like proline 4-hydroxylase